MGTFLVGRGGKETRTTFDLAAVDSLVNGALSPGESDVTPNAPDAAQGLTFDPPVIDTGDLRTGDPSTSPPSAINPSTVSVSTSPNVHVNIEIHIAADATADTVREIFKNMARYVLDKPIADDGE